jgi:aryl-alcohol dehydrogenase-like predicted oxidoreductase
MNDTEQLSRAILGKSGIPVTEIGLGLWAAGGGDWGGTDEDAILDAIDLSLDAGVNFFDTADVYGGGLSEELLGRAMQGRRDRFVVATKIGWVGYDGERNRSAYDTVEKFVAGFETSLRRLGTDYVDLLQSHIFYREPHTEVFLEGFERLQEAGKIRAYGVSTSDFQFLREFNANGGCATLQIDYSILNRTAEADILPYCREQDIGVIVRGALAMGILTGKFDADTRFPPGDFRRNWHEHADEHEVFLRDLEQVEALRAVAGDRSLAELALQFTLAHPAVTTVIPGARNAGQVRSNVQAGLLPPLGGAAMAGIDRIVPPGGGRKIWPA